MKNIIITGTSRGIGLETAIDFAKQGHQVFALSRHQNPKLTAYPNIRWIDFDLTSNNDYLKIEKILTEAAVSIDILIHNAGALLNKPFRETSYQNFLDIYNVNVFGVAQLTQTCIPFMKNGSHVVTISSMGGIQGSMKFAGLAAYSSSKGAVITLSELLAEEYKESGISFNVLALGAVDTEMLQDAFPGYQANVTPENMARYIADFAQNGNQLFNGKVLQVSNSTP